MMLDLDAVRLFVLAVDYGNLTRAAVAAGTVQPVVSTKLKALEASLGRRLLDRTPRYVRLTGAGALFLVRARTLLATHDEAVRLEAAPPARFALGASDHALGLLLEPVLGRVRDALPTGSVIEVRLGLSQDMRAAFDAGLLDAVVLRRESGGTGGEILAMDPLGWRAAPGLIVAPDTPVPLATLGAPCAVRAAAIRRLDHAGRPWREAFVGGSCAALLAAVRAGLGVAPMGGVAAGGFPDAGARLGLPALPESEIVLFARSASPEAAAAIRALAAVLRGGRGAIALTIGNINLS